MLIGALSGALVAGVQIGYWTGYLAVLVLGGVTARRLDKVGRLPDWARAKEPEPPLIDYSVPPPADGPIFNGRADQAPFRSWLRRRRATRQR